MLNLVIYSAEKEIFKGTAESIYVPAREGDFEVLSGHAPILALLDKGLIRLRTDAEEKSFPIEGGFIEVHKDEVTLLIK